MWHAVSARTTFGSEKVPGETKPVGLPTGVPVISVVGVRKGPRWAFLRHSSTRRIGAALNRTFGGPADGPFTGVADDAPAEAAVDDPLLPQPVRVRSPVRTTAATAREVRGIQAAPSGVEVDGR
jgi:hypothetical protein